MVTVGEASAGEEMASVAVAKVKAKEGAGLEAEAKVVVERSKVGVAAAAALVLGSAEAEAEDWEVGGGCDRSLHIAPEICLQRTSLRRHTSIPHTNLRMGIPHNLLVSRLLRTNPHHRMSIRHTSWHSPE